MKSEKLIQDQIQAYMQTIPHVHGIKTILTNTNGTPDLIYCYKGRFLAIEVKAEEGGVTSKLQKRQIKLYRAAGGTAFVASSVKQVKKQLRKLDALK